MRQLDFTSGDVLLVDRRPRPGWLPEMCPPWVAEMSERSANGQYIQLRDPGPAGSWRRASGLRLVDVSRAELLLNLHLVAPGWPA